MKKILSVLVLCVICLNINAQLESFKYYRITIPETTLQPPLPTWLYPTDRDKIVLQLTEEVGKYVQEKAEQEAIAKAQAKAKQEAIAKAKAEQERLKFLEQERQANELKKSKTQAENELKKLEGELKDKKYALEDETGNIIGEYSLNDLNNPEKIEELKDISPKLLEKIKKDNTNMALEIAKQNGLIKDLEYLQNMSDKEKEKILNELEKLMEDGKINDKDLYKLLQERKFLENFSTNFISSFNNDDQGYHGGPSGWNYRSRGTKRIGGSVGEDETGGTYQPTPKRELSEEEKKIIAAVIVVTAVAIGTFFAVRALTEPNRIYNLDYEYRPDYLYNEEVPTVLELFGTTKISYNTLKSKLETENFANGTENQSK